jgi:hypothetical protein
MVVSLWLFTKMVHSKIEETINTGCNENKQDDADNDYSLFENVF